MAPKQGHSLRQRFMHSGIPWRVPSIIILSFLAAICLAAGHHAFYQSLDGSLVRKAMFGQQFNVGIGTAFAFLVRASLVLSIGTTYWQIFWRTLRTNSLAIGKIDTLFGLLHNMFHFLEISSLYRHPLLVSIAFLAWTVPIAIIVPPATLSVISKSVSSYELKEMDVPLFKSRNVMAQMSCSIGDKESDHGFTGSYAPGCDYNGTWLLYNSPSVALSRTTMATAFQGALPNAAQLAINTSYTLSFTAPTTSCIAAPNSVLSQLGAYEIPDGMGRPNKYYDYEYLSWAPSKFQLVSENVKSKAGAFYYPHRQDKYVEISGKIANRSKTGDGFSSYLGQYQDSPPSLFVAYAWFDQDGARTWEALNCSFYDANYTVHFSFPDGDQHVNITSVEFLENPITLSVPISNDCATGGAIRTFLTAKQVGYQALIESLGRALVGTMAFQDGDFEASQLSIEQTSALKTNLAYSNQLAWMYAIGEEFERVRECYNRGATNNQSSVPKTNMTVAATIEQLFHNITLSMFSEKSMLSKNSIRSNVTLISAENAYSYAWNQLVLAYGIAIAVTLFTVLVGCAILFANGAAYSSDFSTFLRLVRGQHIDDVVAIHDDRNGADPLPKALAKARIRIDGIDGRLSAIAKRSPQSNQSSSVVEQGEWSAMLGSSSNHPAHS